jgi:hypothetical protein
MDKLFPLYLAFGSHWVLSPWHSTDRFWSTKKFDIWHGKLGTAIWWSTIIFPTKKGDFGNPPFWGPIFLGLVCHQLGRLGTYGSGATAGSTIWSTSNSKWMACKTFSTMKIPTNANLARKSWPDLPVEIPGLQVILSYAAHQTWLAGESPEPFVELCSWESHRFMMDFPSACLITGEWSYRWPNAVGGRTTAGLLSTEYWSTWSHENHSTVSASRTCCAEGETNATLSMEQSRKICSMVKLYTCD